MAQFFQRPLLIAHRGVANQTRENTMQAFREAVVRGADSIETDVRQLGDGTLVCFHNRKWRRIPLRQLDYQSFIEETEELGWAPPTLEELLDYAKGRVHINLELKERGIEADVVTCISKFGLNQQVLVSSFHDAVIEKIKELDESIPTGLLLGKSLFQHKFRFTAYISDLFPERRIKKVQADVVCPHFRLIRFQFVRRMHAIGCPVHVWTVNDLKRIKRLVKKHADGIMTDQIHGASEMLDEWLENSVTEGKRP
ncbi:glycerophosphodiester phosphodiesterase [Salsuginibacillus kocurii]|uniref:glycerophosphodiester phosphodiesterase n=1 Tax=Salsuginibacillus kocurii TaxID=427078 RepID=UPI00037FB0E3|nr:glycerophosphodiester phosphodiesterase [Salsuginibacillus kocurii]